MGLGRRLPAAERGMMLKSYELIMRRAKISRTTLNDEASDATHPCEVEFFEASHLFDKYHETRKVERGIRINTLMSELVMFFSTPQRVPRS